MERILEHSSIEGMKKTYAKIEEEHELGKLLTRAFGTKPFINKGKNVSLTLKYTIFCR